jgi:hypothetical protein
VAATIYKQILFLKFVYQFTALRFTAAGALLAARRIGILAMKQHASWPITFGMKGSN